ncbi:MAG: UPF0758 domain-containing protein [Anaerobutyricum soehngenii]
MVKYFPISVFRVIWRELREGPIWKDQSCGNDKRAPRKQNVHMRSVSEGQASREPYRRRVLHVIIRCGTKNYSALELAFALLDRHPVYKGLAGLYHLDMEMLKTIPGIGMSRQLRFLLLHWRLAKTSRQRASISKKRVITQLIEYIASYYMEEMRTHLVS